MFCIVVVIIKVRNRNIFHKVCIRAYLLLKQLQEKKRKITKQHGMVKLLSSISPSNRSSFPAKCPLFPCLPFLIFHLLSLLKDLSVDAGMLCACMCAFHICVCFPSVATPHLSDCISKSGSLINTYLCLCSKAIHICASAQRLNICHQAKSNRERKMQKVLYVCVCVFGH